MSSENVPTLIAVMTYLMDRFPNANIPKQTSVAYCSELEEIPPELLWAAVKRVARESEFFPSLALIFQTVADLHAVERRIPSAVEEWEWVTRWIGNEGRGRDAEGHEFAEATVRTMGGWVHLGRGLTQNRDFRRREFIEIYCALLEQAKREWVASPDERRIKAGEDDPAYFERSGRMEKIEGSKLLRKLLKGKPNE